MTVLQVYYINLVTLLVGVAGAVIAIAGLKNSKLFLPSLLGALLISLSGGAGIILLRSLGQRAERGLSEWVLFYMNEVGVTVGVVLLLFTILLFVANRHSVKAG
jgi:hypothetical protein